MAVHDYRFLALRQFGLSEVSDYMLSISGTLHLRMNPHTAAAWPHRSVRMAFLNSGRLHYISQSSCTGHSSQTCCSNLCFRNPGGCHICSVVSIDLGATRRNVPTFLAHSPVRHIDQGRGQTRQWSKRRRGKDYGTGSAVDGRSMASWTYNSPTR